MPLKFLPLENPSSSTLGAICCTHKVLAYNEIVVSPQKASKGTKKKEQKSEPEISRNRKYMRSGTSNPCHLESRCQQDLAAT